MLILVICTGHDGAVIPHYQGYFCDQVFDKANVQVASLPTLFNPLLYLCITRLCPVFKLVEI